MATLLPMPEVVAGATEAVLSHWLVTQEAVFAAGEPLAVLETDKAAIDLEADTDAKLVRTLVADGATVTVGMPLALLAAPDETIDDVEATLASLGVVKDKDDSPTAGTLAPTPGQASASPRADRPAAGKAANEPNRCPFASPLVRKLAVEHQLDLTTITGSGPNGRIVRRDVEKMLAGTSAARTGSATAAPASPVTGAPRGDGVMSDSAGEPAAFPKTDGPHARGGATEILHTRARRAIARRLVESKRQIPHFYLRGSARIDALLELRASLNEVSPTRVSVNDFVVKAAALAHLAVPEMNVVWSGEAMLQYPQVDVGVAIASKRGLVTPVLRGADSASISTISGQLKDLVTRANEGRLGQAELEGGTLAISNLGSYGVEEFSAIINPPHSAILAVGAGHKEAVVDHDGSIRSATVLRVVLSVDHRAADGALAARWMNKFLDLLAKPLALLA